MQAPKAPTTPAAAKEPGTPFPTNLALAGVVLWVLGAFGHRPTNLRWQWSELPSLPLAEAVDRLRDYLSPEVLQICAGAVFLAALVLWVNPFSRAKLPPLPKLTEPLATVLPVLLLALLLLIGAIFVKDDPTSSSLQLAVACLAMLVIGWGVWLDHAGYGNAYQLLRDRLLLALGCAAAFGYCNFGHLHFGVYVHTWDTYHYYMGAKYFGEVGYERLYDCAVVADSETGRRVGPERVLTNLRTNVMEKAVKVLEDKDGRCKSSFAPARWEAFKKDISFFRNRVNEKRWEEMHHDHGFNATPVWILAGWLAANVPLPHPDFSAVGPSPAERDRAPIVFNSEASLTQIVFIDLLDPIYLVLAGAMLWWAFGPRVFALGMIMLGTNWASRFFYWTGGAMLRHDWLFFFVASICLLKKDRPVLAGAAFSYATLLRLFPGLMVFGPLLAGLEYARVRLAHKGALPDDPPRTGLDARLPAWLSPPFARYVVGGLLTTTLLVGTTFALLGGAQTWKTFAANTNKHASTPLTNHMGLRTVMSYRPSTIGQELRDGKLLDNWSVWKDTRVVKFQEAKPAFFALVLASLALLYLAIRRSGTDLWLASALGVGMIVIGAELTNYYYVFFMAMAPVVLKRREAGLIMVSLCATCLFVMLTPLLRMSSWQDEQSTVMSAASVLAVWGVWLVFTQVFDRHATGVEQTVPLFQAPAAATAVKPRKRR